MPQHEPGVAGPLADSAIGDDRLIWRDACPLVQLLQLVRVLEGPIVVARLAPRNALGAGNVATTLTGFGQAGRSQNFTGEFLRTTHVNQRRSLLLHRLLYLGQKRAYRKIWRLCLVGLWLHPCGIGGQFTTFGQPLLTPAVHQAHVLVAIHLQLPQRPCRKPVIVITVKNDARVIGYSGAAEQLLELVGRNNVPHERVAELRAPVPADRAWDVSLIVRRRVDINLNDPDGRIGQMLGHPVSTHQHIGVCILCRHDSPPEQL